MKTRMDRVSFDNMPRSRQQKNEELYQSIKNSEIKDFDSTSNIKIIGESNGGIDVNKLRDILEKNYQEPTKTRRIKYEDISDDVQENEVELEKTRDFDINTILEQAREEKVDDYEKDRLKKIRDTQFDILKSLELDKEENSKVAKEETKEELLDLINTININEKKKELEAINNETDKMDPLDILTELKGDGTIVAGAALLKDDIKEVTKDEDENIEEDVKENDKSKKDEEFDNSFYTNSMSFSKKDFASFDDSKSSIAIKILVVLIFIAIAVGIVIFLNNFLELGWF